MTKKRLTDEQLRILRRPVIGQGGFQSLLRKLRARIIVENGVPKIVLDPELIARIDRYATAYGEGGWQNRLLRGLSGIA